MTNTLEILIRAIDQASATFDSIGKKGTGMSQQLESACIKTGAALTGIGIAAKLAADDVNKAFLGFDKSMTEVKGLGIVGEELEMFRQKALELSKTMPLSADDVANAMYLMVSVGYDYTEMMEAIDPASKLAVAGSIDLASATNALINAMSAYSDDGLTAAKASEVFAKGVGVGKWELNDFLNEMMKNINVASNLGISFEELAAYNVALQNSFTDSSEAGTAFRGVLMNLTETRTIDMLNEMGIAVADSEGNFRGLIPVMQDLNKYFEEHAGTVEKNTILGELFGARSINAATALMQEASAAGTSGSRLDDLVASMSDASFITDQFNAKVDSVGAKLEIADNKMTAAKITLGEAMAPATLIAADAMATFASILENMPEPLQAVVGSFLIFGQSLAVLGPLLMALPTIMGAIGPAATLISGALAGLKIAMGGMAASSIGMTGGLAGVGVTLGTLIPVIGAVVAAVALLYIAWTQNWGGIQEKTAAALQFIQDRLKPVQDVFGKIGDIAGQAFGKIVEAVGKVFGKLDELFKKITGGVGIFDVLNVALQLGAKLWDVWWAVLGKLVTVIGSQLLKAIDWLVDRICDLIDFLGKIADHPVVKWLTNTFGGAIDAAGKAIGGFNKNADLLIDSLNETGYAAEDAAGAVEAGAKTTGDAMGGAAAATKDATSSMKSSMAETGEAANSMADTVAAASREINENWATTAIKNLTISMGSADLNATTPYTPTGEFTNRVLQTPGTPAPAGTPTATVPAAGTPSGSGTASGGTDASGAPIAPTGNPYKKNVDENGKVTYSKNYDDQGNYVGGMQSDSGSQTSGNAATDSNPYGQGGVQGFGVAGGGGYQYQTGESYTWQNGTVTYTDAAGVIKRVEGIAWSEFQRTQGKIVDSYADAAKEVVASTTAATTATAAAAEDTAKTAQKTTQTVISQNDAVVSSAQKTAQKVVQQANDMGAGTIGETAAMKSGVVSETNQMGAQTTQIMTETAINVVGSMDLILQASQDLIANAATAAEAAAVAGGASAGTQPWGTGPFNGYAPPGSGGSSGSSVADLYGSTYISTSGQVIARQYSDAQLDGYLAQWKQDRQTRWDNSMCSGNSFFGMAGGGDVLEGGLAMIGEHGPELGIFPKGAKVSPLKDSSIIDYDKLAKALANALGGAKSKARELHLHIGTVVADESGLRKLKRMLQNVEIAENVRIGAI